MQWAWETCASMRRINKHKIGNGDQPGWDLINFGGNYNPSISKCAVEGQRGPKRGFPTVRCDAPGAVRWRCDAAASRSDAATLCWRCDAALTLRRCDAGAALRRCWRCDAATRDRRCDAVGAATLRRCWRCWRCDAVGAATLRRGTLRRCWRCDVSFCKSAHGVASQLDTLDVYSTWCNALHQGTQGLNDVSLLSCHLGMFILHVVIASFWMA